MRQQEANIIIHEKIMGECAHQNIEMIPVDETRYAYPKCRDCGKNYPKLPNYCEDANEAMKVFEMLGFREVRRFRGVPSGDMYWRVWSSNADERASTLCLAICTAALRLIGITEEVNSER